MIIFQPRNGRETQYGTRTVKKKSAFFKYKERKLIIYLVQKFCRSGTNNHFDTLNPFKGQEGQLKIQHDRGSKRLCLFTFARLDPFKDRSFVISKFLKLI